jgi:hypothetical protein
MIACTMNFVNEEKLIFQTEVARDVFKGHFVCGKKKKKFLAHQFALVTLLI